MNMQDPKFKEYLMALFSDMENLLRMARDLFVGSDTDAQFAHRILRAMESAFVDNKHLMAEIYSSRRHNMRPVMSSILQNQHDAMYSLLALARVRNPDGYKQYVEDARRLQSDLVSKYPRQHALIVNGGIDESSLNDAINSIEMPDYVAKVVAGITGMTAEEVKRAWDEAKV